MIVTFLSVEVNIYRWPAAFERPNNTAEWPRPIEQTTRLC